MPRTPSGKIDRKALPVPDVKRPDLDVAYVRPSGQMQEAIAAVWADLLAIDQVGIDDNFFDLGGNSLLSIQCVAQLESRGLKLPIVKLYQHPTIRACANYLEGGVHMQTPAEMARGAHAERRHQGHSRDRHHRHERSIPRCRQCGGTVEATCSTRRTASAAGPARNWTRAFPRNFAMTPTMSPPVG
jgi:aryl carrier-like protein